MVFPEGELEVSARQTFFEAPLYLVSATGTRLTWQGSGNLYRVPLSYLDGSGDVANVHEWRAKWKGDDGSTEGGPMAWDPGQWRLLADSPGHGASPGGKDPGADVARVAHTPPRPAP
jgi:hypothetical protein